MSRFNKSHFEALFVLSLTLFLIYVIISPVNFDLLSKRGFEEGVVTKVIDGDTVIVEGDRVRLAGIDTDEKGYPCYLEAKKYLENMVLGNAAALEPGLENKDRYGRFLRYLHLNDTNINLKMVREGMAVARFTGETKYESEIRDAEGEARNYNRGCKWSSNNWVEGSDNQKASSGNTIDHEFNYTSPCRAEDRIGENITLAGKVVDVGRTDSAKFLNFGGAYPNSCFTAVIFSDDLKKFSDIEEYEGEQFIITGEVQEYQGTPEIILERRSQLKFLESNR